MLEGVIDLMKNHPLVFIAGWDSIALTVYGGWKMTQRSDFIDMDEHNERARQLQDEEISEESEPILAREGEPVRVTSMPDRPTWMEN